MNTACVAEIETFKNSKILWHEEKAYKIMQLDQNRFRSGTFPKSTAH